MFTFFFYLNELPIETLAKEEVLHVLQRRIPNWTCK